MIDGEDFFLQLMDDPDWIHELMETGTKTAIGYRNSDTLEDAAQFLSFIRNESGREQIFTSFARPRLLALDYLYPSSQCLRCETRRGLTNLLLRLLCRRAIAR